MFEIIKKTVDRWDPIGLTTCSPSDEYDIECRRIAELLINSHKPIENVIYDVFVDAFGTSFHCDLQQCAEIAQEIKKNM